MLSHISRNSPGKLHGSEERLQTLFCPLFIFGVSHVYCTSYPPHQAPHCTLQLPTLTTAGRQKRISYNMRPEITLKQFRVLVFDVYGTLADWETGIFQAIRPTLERASSPWTKEEALLAFTSVEKDLQVQHPEMPYNELLGMVYHAFSERLGVHTTPEEDRAFGSSIAQWPVFPDTVAALAILRKYYKIVVLSNVDNNSFDAFTRKALEPNADAPIFDLVITAQDIGSYKPDPANFKFALNAIKGKLDIDEEGVLFTAQSLFHDHKPVNALGLHSAWIAREGAIMGMDADATYDFKFDTLMDMAKARESQ